MAESEDGNIVKMPTQGQVQYVVNTL